MSNQESFNFNYDKRNSDTRDVIMSLNMTFDNPSEDELKERLNTWLKAIGVNLIVVDSLNI